MNVAQEFDSLIKTAEQAGMKIYSDDTCAKILAYLYICGGGNEAVVLNQGLNLAIKHAQKRANLFGGEKPDSNMVSKINHYSDDLEGYLLFKNPKPAWFNEFGERFNLKLK